MNKFNKLHKLLMEDLGAEIMDADFDMHEFLQKKKVQKDTFVFNEGEFERAFRRAWNPEQTRKMRYFYPGIHNIQEMKDIYKEILTAPNPKTAYKIWTRIATDGFLFQLMWQLGYDCSYSDKNQTLTFVPHVASESVIKENSVYDAKRDFHSYYYIPNQEQVYNRAIKELQKENMKIKQGDLERMAGKIAREIATFHLFEDEEDYELSFWDEYAQTVNDYKFRGIIKEDVNLAPHVKKMQGYWKKDSNPQRLIKSIDNPDKLINRWLAAIKIGWTYAAEEFEKAIRERGLLTDEEIAEKKSKYSLDDEVKVPERSKDEQRNLSSWTTRSVYLALQKICEERNYKFELKHSKNWNAVTDTGKEMMARNGRAWTVGYELVVTNEGGTGREVHYDLDVVTNEGGGLYGYVWGMAQTWRPTSLKQLIYDMQDSFDRDFEGKKQWNW